MNEALRNTLMAELKKLKKPVRLEDVQKRAEIALKDYPKEAGEFREWLLINHEHFLWQLNR